LSYVDGYRRLPGWRPGTDEGATGDRMMNASKHTPEPTPTHLREKTKMSRRTDENDEPTNQGSNVHAEKRRLQKLLNKYIRKLRKTCKASGTPKPEAGDCFYCQMVRDDNGRPLANDDCLRSHLEETYVHGSLILNAIRSRGRRCPEAVWNMHDIVCQDVRAYFKRELGI
jgi:hypothetical protein